MPLNPAFKIYFERCGKQLFTLCLVGVLCFLAACSSSGNGSRDGSGASGGYYKVGNPYQVGGNWFYPAEDYAYDETGIASWYGADFHGNKTANGEVFNKNELTAAHKTLPMPSLARVTNLDNGRSIVLRINDRGPFSGKRIIDVTQRAAQLLGFERQGTAKVRVQVLADESRAIADAMRRYGPGASGTQYAAGTTSVMSSENAIYDQQNSAPDDLATHIQSAPLTGVSRQALALTSGSTAESAMKGEYAYDGQAQLQTALSKNAAKNAINNFQPEAIVSQYPVTGLRQIYVQAGAFTKYENALGLKNKLGRFGKVSVADTVVNGTKYYRVRLGPVPDVAKADLLVNKVTQAGYTSARTVVD